MTFEQIKAVNAEIETVDIRGNEYAEVHERVQAFRKLCPDGAIVPEIIQLSDEGCCFKVSVYDADGKILSTGHAYEVKTTKGINMTSFVENCETSAVGRALSFIGIGSKSAIASADEMARAAEAEQQARESGPPKEYKPKNKTEVPEAPKSFKEQAKAAWKAMYPNASINPIMIKVFGLTENTTEEDYEKILDRIRNENLDSAIAKAEKEANA